MIIPERKKYKKIFLWIAVAMVVAGVAFLYAFWLISQAGPGVKLGYRCLGSVCSQNGDGDLCLNDKNCQPRLRCSGSSCVLGGAGKICSKNNDCATSMGIFEEDCSGSACQVAAAKNMTVSFAPYDSGLPGSGIAYFSWTYGSEGDIAADECRFKLQISENKNFDTLVVNRIIPGQDSYCLDLPVGTKQSQAVRIELASNLVNEGWLNFKKTYYWRVQTIAKGEDKNTKFSAISLVKVPGHPAPSVSFLVSSDFINPGTIVYFTDKSVCYTAESFYDCKDGKNVSYLWEFGDAGSKEVDYISYYKGDVKHPYEDPATAKLTICDDLGCSSASKTIRIIGSLPVWSEASPF